MITTIQCAKALRKAVQDFGTHNLYDKGPSEVMDIPKIVKGLEDMDAKQIADMLAGILQYNHGVALVEELLSALDSREDLDDLYQDPRLQAYY